jgi:Fe-S-cluster-containing dehydrogenase component
MPLKHFFQVTLYNSTMLEADKPAEKCGLCTKNPKAGDTDACLECLDDLAQEFEEIVKEAGHKKISKSPEKRRADAGSRRKLRKTAKGLRDTIAKLKRERGN